MALPKLVIVANRNNQYIEWTITNGITGAAVNDANTTATLYKNRDINDPDTTPGSSVTGITALTLSFVASGVYRGLVPATFDSDPNASYVLTVDAVSPTSGVGHWEVVSEVETRTY